MTTVRVLFGHSFAVATPKPIVIRGSRFLTIRFGTSAPKRKAEVKFHYPFWFPNRKAEVGVHYSFWNFCFQFEKPNRFSTIRFGTFAPKTKGGAVGVELSFWNMNGRAKSTSHYPFWNRCSKWKTPKRNSTIPLFNFPSKSKLGSPLTKKNGDPKNGRGWWVCLWGEGSAWP